MGAQCELTGKAFKVGNKVSHSNRKTKRKFVPNLHSLSFFSELLNKVYKMRVAVSTVRTVDRRGGLDNYLLTVKNLRLTPKALRIKKLLQKKVVEIDDSEEKSENE